MKREIEKTYCNNCINRKKSMLYNLPEHEVQLVDAVKSCLIYKKNEIIFKEGSSPQGVHCIKYGKVKIYKTGFEGKSQIIKFAKEGDLIGYRSLLSNEKFNASAACIEETMVCFIPKESILKIVSGNNCFAMNLMKAACHDLGEASKTITTLAQKSIRERVAEVLLALQASFGLDARNSINVILTREDIANMVGTATESVIRELAKLNEKGFIELDGKKIKLLNIPGLIKVAKIN